MSNSGFQIVTFSVALTVDKDHKFSDTEKEWIAKSFGEKITNIIKEEWNNYIFDKIESDNRLISIKIVRGHDYVK